MANPHGFTDEQMAALTPAEREGLLDPNLTDDFIEEDDDAAADAAGANQSDKPEIDAEDEFADDPEEEDAPDGYDYDAAVAALAAENPVEGAQQKPAEQGAAEIDLIDPSIDDEFLATLPAPLPFPPVDDAKAAVAKADESVSALDAQIADLQAQYDAGDLDLSETEYRAQIAALNSKHAAAIREAGKLDGSVERAMSELNVSLDKWSKEVVPGFLADKPAIFRDPNSVVYQTMNKFVRDEQTRTAQPFDPRHLHIAYKKVVDLLDADGLWPPRGYKLPAKAKEQEPKPEPKKADPRPAPPPTLAHMPAAEIETASGVDPEFAQLDKLTGAAYERKFQALSPDRRAAYVDR